MASDNSYGLGLIWLCLLLFGNGVQGRGLQNVEKEMKGFNQSGGYSRGVIDQSYHKRGVHPHDSVSNRIYHWAIYKAQEGEYYGVQATINLYALRQVQPNQLSSAEIWVVNGVGGPADKFNAIQAGWHVHPKLYGDHQTRFFIYWTVDGYQSSKCYNFQCKGFFLDKSAQIKPGDVLYPLSIYNGDQFYITLKISQDPVSGDWWLHAGLDAAIPIGYWPRRLFSSLYNSASHIDLGGISSFLKYEKSPPMGSGHSPDEGAGKAASIIHIKFVDKEGVLHEPQDGDFAPYQDSPCYNVSAIQRPGYGFYFGGPGGCSD